MDTISDVMPVEYIQSTRKRGVLLGMELTAPWMRA